MSRKCPWSIFWLDSVAGACNEVEDLPVRLNNNGNDRLSVSRRFHQDWHPATSILWCFLSWDCYKLFDGRIQNGRLSLVSFSVASWCSQQTTNLPSRLVLLYWVEHKCSHLITLTRRRIVCHKCHVRSCWPADYSSEPNSRSIPYIASECMRLWDSLPRKKPFTTVPHSSGQLCYSLSHCWWNGMARGILGGGTAQSRDLSSKISVVARNQPSQREKIFFTGHKQYHMDR